MQQPRPVNDNDEQPQSQQANAMDRYVGGRIRELRVMAGLSQQQLAGRIGVTYQQSHKYEHGFNRISAGRLFAIAQVLGVNPSWFFDGVEQGDAHEPMPRERRTLELTRNFSLINNEAHQNALSEMARSLAGQLPAKTAE